MIRAVLVLAWYTCALPSPDRPCVEIETKAYSSILEAVRGYHQGVDALDRKLYFIGKDGAEEVREYGYDPKSDYGRLKITGRIVESDKSFEELSREAAAKTDAELCIKGLQNRDQFMINMSCKLNCDAMAGASSDLEITDEVRDFIFATLKKCRTDRQARARNRLVCGKDKCP